MKRTIFITALLIIFSFAVFAQKEKEEDKSKGFQKERLFTGGSITASFFTGGTILGASPIFGYQLANWVDAGVVINYTYEGQRDYQFQNDKLRQNVYGPGIFTRIYPFRFLFVQGQFEHNFTRVNYTDPGGFKSSFKTDANSFLVGAGIAEGRQKGSNTFFYISLLFDVLKDRDSPYVNNVYDLNTGQYLRTDMVPVIRAGINIGLFQGHNRQGEERGNGSKHPRNYEG